MARWLSECNIKPLLSEDDVDDATAALIGKQIAAKVRADLELTDEYIEEEHELSEAMWYLTRADCQDDVNEGLNHLYDWADANRVWLGL